jgi:ABC-type oligopeptide transport system substrate-binding subunit
VKQTKHQVLKKVRDKAWKQASTQVNNKAKIWSQIYRSREQILVYNRVVVPIWSQVLRLLAKPIQRSPK